MSQWTLFWAREISCIIYDRHRLQWKLLWILIPLSSYRRTAPILQAFCMKKRCWCEQYYRVPTVYKYKTFPSCVDNSKRRTILVYCWSLNSKHHNIVFEDCYLNWKLFTYSVYIFVKKLCLSLRRNSSLHL